MNADAEALPPDGTECKLGASAAGLGSWVMDGMSGESKIVCGEESVNEDYCYVSKGLLGEGGCREHW